MKQYTMEMLSVGVKESFTITVTPEMMRAFCEITADYNPMHVDPVYARNQGFPSCIAYGMLTASFLSTLAGMYLPGERSLIHHVEMDFVKPVFVGDQLTVMGEVVEIDERYSLIRIRMTILNQTDQKVLRGKMQIGVRS